MVGKFPAKFHAWKRLRFFFFWDMTEIMAPEARVSRNSRNFSGLIIRPEKFREFRETRACPLNMKPL